VFSSLNRVDIVLKPGPDGRRRFVQTDHRTAAEVAQEPELSAVFALVRILAPRRLAEPGEPEPLVIYSARERPPESLRQVIHAASGQLVIGDDLQPLVEEAGSPPLEEVIEAAFANLARAVAAEHNAPLNLAGLEAVERSLADSAADPEEDEVAYWSAVVKLGSFGGEIMRAANRGQWIVPDSGSLPFALLTRFRGEQATVNPLGKAIKRFTNGEGDTLVALVNLICSQP
jgi:hypothetical protein